MVAEKDARVFCMEDGGRIRRLYQRIFGSRFAEVYLVDTCEALVSAFLEKRSETKVSFDLVFLDMKIYGENFCGLRALAELKKIDPNVCAVLCSASNHDAMDNPVRFGFKASLEKPFTMEQFNAVVKSVLSR